jgi:L-lactate dehydrogenase complex protein LldE
MIVDIFIPYEIDQFYPETAQHAICILERLGCKVEYHLSQTDVGQIAFENGNWDEAKKTGAKFIKDFKTVHPVVIPSTSVVNFIRKHYSKLFFNSTYHSEYQQLTNNIFEFSDFIFTKLGARDIGAGFDHIVTVHDCYIPENKYIMMKLLSCVNGIKVLESRYEHEECGSNMVFSIYNRHVAEAMALRHLEHAEKNGAEYIVVADTICKIHLDNIIKKHKKTLSTIHVVDILTSRF